LGRAGVAGAAQCAKEATARTNTGILHSVQDDYVV